MTTSDVIAQQRRSLLVFAERQGVTEACRAFGVSRTTFYKIKGQFLETGSVAPKIRRKPKMPNEASLGKKKLLLQMVKDHPSWGPVRYTDEFRKQGISICPSCIWYHLNKFGLSRRYQRLVYLEELNMRNQPITERNLRSLKQTHLKVKQGLYPGHIVGIDTFYIGHLKGVGRIYQMTGIDLCSRFGWAELYTDKSQQSSTDFVERHLIPKFYHNGVALESILSDNGSEFTGDTFQTMLAEYGIIHHRIPKGKPIFNGCCERFQRTLHEELYKRVFRIRYFNNLDELKKELNSYLVFYNFERTHFGITKTGAKPIDVFTAKRSFLRQRFLKLLT